MKPSVEWKNELENRRWIHPGQGFDTLLTRTCTLQLPDQEPRTSLAKSMSGKINSKMVLLENLAALTETLKVSEVHVDGGTITLFLVWNRTIGLRSDLETKGAVGWNRTEYGDHWSRQNCYETADLNELLT